MVAAAARRGSAALALPPGRAWDALFLSAAAPVTGDPADAVGGAVSLVVASGMFVYGEPVKSGF